MNKLVLIALVSFFSVCCKQAYGQAVYHISATGDDQNSGLSASAAFKSIGKINSLALNPGDSVLFKRGDTFRGQLNIRQSGSPGKPIVISAYGNGARSVLNGSVIVNKWTQKGNNIWEADCPRCGDSVTGVYFNHLPLPLGRYPNSNGPDKGYLKIQNHQGSAQFTGVPGGVNWTGAEVVIRTNDWIIDKLRIASQNGSAFILKSGASYEIKDNWGYFIQDHPATLDQNGEWYYDRANKKLLICFAGANPNDNLIEATAFGRCVNIYASNITIQDVEATEALNIGIYGRNASNLAVINSKISNMGEDGIVINGSGENITLKGNLIDHVYNDGVYVTGFSNFTCVANTLKSIGTVAGRGKSNNGQYIGIQYNYSGDSGSTVIKNNELDSLGYIGIDFNSANVLVEQNVINAFDLVKNDGGGIHTYNGKNHAPRKNEKIESNIVYNGVGANPGTTDGFTGATGIYLDGGSENIEVTGNTVFNCTGAGIFLHGSNNVSVSGNSSYGNNIQFLMTDDDQDGYDSKSNSISNNIFLSRNDKQLEEKLLHHHSVAANETAFPNTVFKANPKPKNRSNLFLSNDAVLFELNRSAIPKNVRLTGPYQDMNGNVYHDTVSVKPYSSIILLKIKP